MQWDYVVLQDYSTRPTHIGDRGQHRADIASMANLVRAHSPEVTPILFETWERKPGHSYYAGTTSEFPGGPAQMQRELREGYNQSAEDLHFLFGVPAPVARVRQTITTPIPAVRTWQHWSSSERSTTGPWLACRKFSTH